MNKALFLAISFLHITISHSENIDKGFSVTDDSLQISVSSPRDKIIHVQVVPLGSQPSKSLIIPETSDPVPDCQIQKGDNYISLRTASVTATYSYTDKNIRFTDSKSGKQLLQEQARSFEQKKVAGETVWQIKQIFKLHPDEALYGLGQYQEGIMNYRGQKAKLVQANMEIVNPFLLSTQPYGILWDNYSKTLFEDNEKGASFWSEVADAIDYYFVYGTDMKDVVAGYHRLTGKVPMFPKSAFGYWQSKERYKSFDELIDVVKEYRKRHIPLDNIVQDWEYWGDRDHWNSLRFDTVNFNHPTDVIRQLHDRYNVSLMLSVWPGFGKKTDVYKDMEKIGALFDEPTWADYKVMDIYNPQAQKIFWEHLYKGLYRTGVDAWWMDATEPSFREGFTQDKQEEKTKSAGQTYIGSFDRYLNVYSLFLSKAMYENIRKQDNKRVTILTRSAFAGQQQYGTAVWSGDITASWDVFRKQLPAGLNLCMSGIPYWTTDIGGFFVTTRGSQYTKGLADPSYKELYLRWFQQGVFSPIFRAHGSNVPREVWQFGEPGDPFYDGLLKMIDLRYSLLSYIYSSAWQVTANSRLMMRGLVMDFPDDRNVHNRADAYMFGPSLLVKPITKPMYYTTEGAIGTPDTKESVYLPEHTGKYWFDFNSRQIYTGGKTISYLTPLDVIPVFVKAGSIIPINKIVQYVGEQKEEELELRIYAGADADFELYEDDNKTYAYENGVYSLVRFHWDDQNKQLSIYDKEGTFVNYPQRSFRIKLYIAEESSSNYSVREKLIRYENKHITVDMIK
ncbi:DUF5110 domain-containing protein [Parabacteroides sp. AF18-52]|jgi:glycoside hydrolase family 31|uniref:glycoside hydrolase family 31 protein n=1 Tax=Parabacteroides TaxID=375288 RepID=UPI000EFFDD86|nr:TIM-barrel domain-containing protein [Parabacteroides sp. AF18-52]RHR37420.1 DUF5110 domain-containing protein [Parabacteroides sp. AF18-52]